MKRYINYCATLMAVAALSACSDTFQPATPGDGEGRLMIKATVNSDVVVKTRAGETNDELAAATRIWISNGSGAVAKFNSINEVPYGGLTLLSGNYVAEAWAGDSVSASWDSRYFYGRQPFDISKGSTTQINIECKIANTLVSVEYEPKIAELLSDVTMEVGHDPATGTRNGTLTFDADTPESAKAYFMTNSRSKDLLYTLKGTLISTGKAFEYSGRLENVERATEYHLIVKHNDQAEEQVGGAWITIEVDTSEVEVEDSFEITAPPAISGIGFDLSTPVAGTLGELPRRSLWIAAAADLESVELKSPAFLTIENLGGDDFELFGMSDHIRSIVEGAGINYVVSRHEDTGFAEVKVNFEPEFLNSLPEGTYPITVTATDINGRMAVATLTVMPTNAKLMTDQIDPEDMSITSRGAILSARVLRDDASNWGIQYRVKGTMQWTQVPAGSPSAVASRAAGEAYSVTLTGLQPSTTYQYVAYCDNFEGSDICEFTTEGEPQLENAGFEDWSTASDKAAMPAADPNNFFWDTGNHGSQKMGKDITVAASDLKHSGEYSIKLCSQFVGIGGSLGKFAAGNVFIGKYLNTEGLSDGVLGWGRPFTARPKAMRVWVKYTPAKVDNVQSNNSDGVKKGDMDKGMIRIALVDNAKTSYNGENWPYVIKTADTSTLFNPSADRVIAVGEKIFTEATPGDGLIEVIIPIDYHRTDIRPSNILMVASASKMGDYFTGGPSTMYLDDIELIYE